MQYNTTQYKTTQYTTIHCNTLQYNSRIWRYITKKLSRIWVCDGNYVSCELDILLFDEVFIFLMIKNLLYLSYLALLATLYRI